MTYLVVGLGNPGKRYENTRHNIGFRVVEELSRKLSVSPQESNRFYLKGEGRWEGITIILLQPLTYMNRSGLAVAKVLNKCQLPPEKAVVVYDDMDLEPGRVKIKPKGGSGGHRGIHSIMSTLGTTDFIRVRVGIGKPPPWMEGSQYVLGKPTGEEREDLKEGEEKAAQAVLTLVTEGLNYAMNKFNKSVDI